MSPVESYSTESHKRQHSRCLQGAIADFFLSIRYASHWIDGAAGCIAVIAGISAV